MLIYNFLTMILFMTFIPNFCDFYAHAVDLPSKGASEIPQPFSQGGAKLVTGYSRRGKTVLLYSPSVLDKPDTEYILQNDIVADGTAFRITADRVTLNLNSHTVVYDSKKGNDTAYGVHLSGWTRNDIEIVNGAIIQGEGNTPGKLNEYGTGSNPICGMSVEKFIAAGLTIRYQSIDTSGIYVLGSDVHIHHNTIEDNGSTVTNRHQGLATIEGRASSGMHIHDNRIVRTRHIGIRSGKDSQVYGNDIKIDSWNTNSTGIVAGGSGAKNQTRGNARIHHNRIIGRGIHPIGIWPGSDSEVYENYVDVQNTRTGSEYGDTGSACFRILWATNVRVYNNKFFLHAEENYNNTGVKSWGRAVWIGLPEENLRVIFENNTIVALNDDGKAKAAAIAVVYRNESSHLVFKGNTVISNWCNVLLGDSYGHAGGFPRFIDNRFIRTDDHPSYRTIRSQYSSRTSTGVFINNSFEGGASPDNIDLEFHGDSLKEVGFGWHFNTTVLDSGIPVSAASVQIIDASGQSVFNGVTDRQGKISADLISYFRTNRAEFYSPEHKKRRGSDEKGVRVDRTPHRVVVSKGSRIIEKGFMLNRNLDLVLDMSSQDGT